MLENWYTTSYGSARWWRRISRRSLKEASARATMPLANAAMRVRLYHRSQCQTAVPQLNVRLSLPRRRSGSGWPVDGKKQSIRWPRLLSPSSSSLLTPGTPPSAPGAGPSQAIRSDRAAIGAPPYRSPGRLTGPLERARWTFHLFHRTGDRPRREAVAERLTPRSARRSRRRVPALTRAPRGLRWRPRTTADRGA